MSNFQNKFNQNIQSAMGKAMKVVTASGEISYDFRNLEKVPTDIPCVFVVNHSNMHDYPNLMMVLSELSSIRKRRCVTTLVAHDSLDTVNKAIFSVSGAELIDRFDKVSARIGQNNLVSKLKQGNDILFFGEGTWNLHPYEPMQKIRKGFANVASAAECAVVPIVFEYVENKDICQKESEIYKAFIASVCSPIYLKDSSDALEVSSYVRKILADERRKLWKETRTHQASLDERKFTIREEDVYLNHVELKKNASAFSYDSIYELGVLLPLDETRGIENEYIRDENGLFVPLKQDSKVLRLKKEK